MPELWTSVFDHVPRAADSSRNEGDAMSSTAAHPRPTLTSGAIVPDLARDRELEQRAFAMRANRELEDASATEILQWAWDRFGRRLVVTSSLADTVLIHLAEQVAPGIDVVFLDTGYHFVETIGTRDAVEAVHDVNLITVTPAQTVAEQDATWGKDLFARHPDQCCALRKV